MRQTLLVITVVNVAVIAGAALAGQLPPWPDIRQPEITGVPLFEFQGEDLSISNSLFTMWLVMAFLIGVSWVATRRLSDQPGRLQSLVEQLVQGFSDFVVGVGGQSALRFLSLSLLLRLWGNIWAGEIALSVSTALVVVPIFAAPLIGLELLVGLVQALVFSLLVLVYITLAIESHDDGHDDPHDAHPATH